jgi:hypothetical protein
LHFTLNGGLKIYRRQNAKTSPDAALERREGGWVEAMSIKTRSNRKSINFEIVPEEGWRMTETRSELRSQKLRGESEMEQMNGNQDANIFIN